MNNTEKDSDNLIMTIMENYDKDLQCYNLDNKNGTNMWDVFNDKFIFFIKDYDNWKYFRRNGLTCGIETGLLQTDREKYLGIKKYTEYNVDEIKQVIDRYNELSNMINNKEIIENYLCSNVGNPRTHVLTNDISLNVDDLYILYSFWQIIRYIKLLNFSCNTILEIGGGYGNLTCKLLKWCKSLKLYENTTFILVDLPETLILQHYYIKMNNPDYKIQKINSITDTIDMNNDVILVPCSYVNVLNESKFDLVVNMRSFGEMNNTILQTYFDLINKNINNNGLMYTINRYVTSRGKDTIKFKNYQFGDNWETICSHPTWLQTHSHEMLIRKKENPLIPFSQILQSFPNISPPPGPYSFDYDLHKWAKNNNILV